MVSFSIILAREHCSIWEQLVCAIMLAREHRSIREQLVCAIMLVKEHCSIWEQYVLNEEFQFLCLCGNFSFAEEFTIISWLLVLAIQRSFGNNAQPFCFVFLLELKAQNCQ